MAAHEQQVVQPHNKPSIERINRDLKNLYDIPVEALPVQLRMLLWYCWWQSIHPAATDEYREMMSEMGLWNETVASHILKLLSENQQLRQALEEQGYSKKDIRKMAQTG